MSDAIRRHQDYLTGRFKLVDRVEELLERIAVNSHLNAFIRVFSRRKLLSDAAALDRKRAEGKSLGPLAGLVIAVKDNISYRGQRLTCASRILKKFIPPYHATVIEKILQADGLIIGKTNLDEFAMGSSGETSYFGPVRNPWDLERVPGGSSSGSAVAVRAEMADLALGSDTGGSVRQPAAFCGVVGLKPTYGLVSRFGLVAYASSLDQIGPLGKSVTDVAHLLQVIAGHDPRDSTSVRQAIPAYAEFRKIRPENLRIGLPGSYFRDGVDPEVQAILEQLVAVLKQKGFHFREIDLPLSEYAVPAYYIIAMAEASSNLARYDGVRYGLRWQAPNLAEQYSRTRAEGFGAEVKRRILLGTFVLSAGYYDAYYKKAQQVRRLIQEEFRHAFREVDVILTPTTPTPAFKLGEKTADPIQMYRSDVFTVTANLAGICALSVPVGLTTTGLPIGVQLLGDFFREDRIIALGRFIEELGDFGKGKR